MKPLHKRGDIVLVRFPFTDLSSSKVRPALVFKNQEDSDVTLLPISSTFQLRPFDFILEKQHYAAKALPIDSIVCLSKIVTVHASLIHKKATELTPEVTQEILRAFAIYMEL